MFDQGQQQKPITLFVFRGYLNELKNKQWVPLFNGEAKKFEINRPNKLRVVDQIGGFPDINFEPNGKVIFKGGSHFVLQPNGLVPGHIFGILLSEDSNVSKFKETLDNLIKNLSVRPRMQQQPSSQYNAMSSENSLMSMESLSFNTVRDSLASAIKDGNIKESHRLVEMLANAHSQLAIYFVDKQNTDPDSDSEDGNKMPGVSLKVRVIDHENLHSNAAVDTYVENLKKTTIEQMKLRFFNEHNFPIAAQRWIIEGRVANDCDSLRFCGASNEESEIFLYITSNNLPKNNSNVNTQFENENIYDEIPGLAPHQQQQQQQQQQPQPLFQRVRFQGPNQQHSPVATNPQPFYKHQHPPYNLGRMFQSMAVSSNVPGNARPNFDSIGPYEYGEFQQPQHMQFHPRPADVLNQPPPIPLHQPPPIPLHRQPPLQRPQAAKIKKQEVGWTCPKCTFINMPTFESCSVCFNNRPEGYQVPEGYVLTEEEEIREAEAKLNEKLALEAEFKRKEKETEEAKQNYYQVMMYAQKKVLPNTEDFDCPICYTNIDKGEGIMLRECYHSFCRECLAQTIITSEESEIKCPENTEYPCEFVITAQEISELLTQDEYSKYLARGLKHAEMSMSNSFHCKTVNCGGWVIYEDDVNEFYCQLCNKNNCLTCQAQHPDMTCKQYQDDLKTRAQNDDAARKTQEMIQGLLDNGEAMNCPQCKVILQKKSGCDWMRCSMCKTEICWATKGPRWGPGGKGDTSAGCKCGVNGGRCTPTCGNCH